MRHRFDHLAQQIGREALGRSGATAVHHEITPETQYADLHHEPDPACRAERKHLGLLGRMAAALCLIETYGHAPSAEEFRACLSTLLAFWQQRMRATRTENKKRRKNRQPPKAIIKPFLWVVAAGAPTALLTRLKLEPAPGWPTGVYFFGEDVLRVGIVVASQLPLDRSTLLVRLMAAGPLLPRAIQDLAALPSDAHERAVAEESLLRLQHVLGSKPSRSPEEQEFVVTMYKSFEDVRTENQAEAVFTVLRVRGITVPAAARKRILAQEDLQQLKRWHEKAIVATSIEEVIGNERRAPARSRTRHAGRSRGAASVR